MQQQKEKVASHQLYQYQKAGISAGTGTSNCKYSNACNSIASLPEAS